MKHFIMLMILTIAFVSVMPAISYAGAVIIGERVEFRIANPGAIIERPYISMRIHFRVERGPIVLTGIDYSTNPASPPPPVIIGEPRPEYRDTGTFNTGSHVVAIDYAVQRETSLIPRKICFDFTARFQDARYPPQTIIRDACLEAVMIPAGGITVHHTPTPVLPPRTN